MSRSVSELERSSFLNKSQAMSESIESFRSQNVFIAKQITEVMRLINKYAKESPLISAIGAICRTKSYEASMEPRMMPRSPAPSTTSLGMDPEETLHQTLVSAQERNETLRRKFGDIMRCVDQYCLDESLRGRVIEVQQCYVNNSGHMASRKGPDAHMSLIPVKREEPKHAEEVTAEAEDQEQTPKSQNTSLNEDSDSPRRNSCTCCRAASAADVALGVTCAFLGWRYPHGTPLYGFSSCREGEEETWNRYAANESVPRLCTLGSSCKIDGDDDIPSVHSVPVCCYNYHTTRSATEGVARPFTKICAAKHEAVDSCAAVKVLKSQKETTEITVLQRQDNLVAKPGLGTIEQVEQDKSVKHSVEVPPPRAQQESFISQDGVQVELKRVASKAVQTIKQEDSREVPVSAVFHNSEREFCSVKDDMLQRTPQRDIYTQTSFENFDSAARRKSLPQRVSVTDSRKSDRRVPPPFSQLNESTKSKRRSTNDEIPVESRKETQEELLSDREYVSKQYNAPCTDKPSEDAQEPAVNDEYMQEQKIVKETGKRTFDVSSVTPELRVPWSEQASPFVSSNDNRVAKITPQRLLEEVAPRSSCVSESGTKPAVRETLEKKVQTDESGPSVYAGIHIHNQKIEKKPSIVEHLSTDYRDHTHLSSLARIASDECPEIAAHKKLVSQELAAENAEAASVSVRDAKPLSRSSDVKGFLGKALQKAPSSTDTSEGSKVSSRSQSSQERPNELTDNKAHGGHVAHTIATQTSPELAMSLGSLLLQSNSLTSSNELPSKSHLVRSVAPHTTPVIDMGRKEVLLKPQMVAKVSPGRRELRRDHKSMYYDCYFLTVKRRKPERLISGKA